MMDYFKVDQRRNRTGRSKQTFRRGIDIDDRNRVAPLRPFLLGRSCYLQAVSYVSKDEASSIGRGAL